MFNTRQNFHHSKLPKLGEIVELPSGNRGNVKRLDTGKTIRIAGTWVYSN